MVVFNQKIKVGHVIALLMLLSLSVNKSEGFSLSKKNYHVIINNKIPVLVSSSSPTITTSYSYPLGSSTVNTMTLFSIRSRSNNSSSMSKGKGEEGRINIIANRISNVMKRVSLNYKMMHKTAFVLLFSAVLLCSRSLPSTASMSSSSVVSPSSVSTKLVTSSSSGNIAGNSYDKLIMKYVEKHMWDDDTYDPFESTYREAYNDKITNQNDVLKYINSNSYNTILPLKQTKLFNPLKLPSLLISSAVSLGTKYGLDPRLVRTSMAALIVTLTPVSLLYFLLSAGGVFRKVLMKRETKRYGAISDLSAEEKEEDPDIDLDDEEDDDDDDDINQKD